MSVLRLPPAPPTRGAAWPELTGIFQHARDFAWGIAARLVDMCTAEATLLNTPGVRAAFRRRHREGDFESSALLFDLAWTLRDTITEFELERAYAEGGIRKPVSALLHEGACRARALSAALEANADGLLTPTEIERIVATEFAWWARHQLPAALPPPSAPFEQEARA